MRFHSFVYLLITLIVVAVTAMNSYTTQMNCDVYLSGVEFNNNELVRTRIVQNTQVLLAEKDAQLNNVVEVAKSEAQRADNIQSEFNALAKQYVQLRHAYNNACMEIRALQQSLVAVGEYVRAAHEFMKEHGITPPELPDLCPSQEPTPEPTPELSPEPTPEPTPSLSTPLENKTV